MNEIKTVEDLRRYFESMTTIDSFSLGEENIAYQKWLEGETLKRYVKPVNEIRDCKKYGIFQHIRCRFLGHVFETTKVITPQIRELRCKRCGKRFGINDDTQSLLPLDAELLHAHSVLLNGI